VYASHPSLSFDMLHPYVISMPSLHIAPSPALDNSKKQAKMLHCNVPLLLSTPDCNHSLLQVVEPSATMERSRSVDSDKLKNFIKTLINLPDLKVPPRKRLPISPCIASSGNLSLAKCEGLEGTCVRSSSATTAAT
jgi:hypothetical protein